MNAGERGCSGELVGSRSRPDPTSSFHLVLLRREDNQLLHVILDTNIYRNNPDRSNLNFKALEKLAKANAITLYIPYVVEREFQTQQRDLYSKDLEKSLSGLSGLVRKPLSPELHDKVTNLLEELNNAKEPILSDSEDQFVKWSQSINGIRQPLCLEQAMGALEAYFKGSPPFKKIKNRDDIPDSFIVRAIEKIACDSGDVHIVVGDKKVQEAFRDNKSCFIYESLSVFIDTDFIQNELKDIDVVENMENIKCAIIDYETEYNDLAREVSSSIGPELMWKKIYDSTIRDDNNEATICGYSDPNEVVLELKDMKYYGNSSFGVPFSLNLFVSAIYYIFKSDYYCMDFESVERPSVTDHNDHYFEAEEEFEISVTGIANLTIDRDNIDFDDFGACVDLDAIRIDSIENIELCH